MMNRLKLEKNLKIIVVGAVVISIVCLASGLLLPAKIAALAVGAGSLFYSAVAL